MRSNSRHLRASRLFWILVLVAGVGMAVAACGQQPGKDAIEATGRPDGGKPITKTPTKTPATVVNDQRFHPVLLSRGGNYGMYGNVDDIGRWVPGLCRIPYMTIRASKSKDPGTHGGKLYWMHAKDRDAYLAAGPGKVQPVGQVLVKEAFAAKPGPAPDEGGKRKYYMGGRSIVRGTATRDGKSFHAGELKALYVMLKLDPKTEGTDEGWVYGTLTADRKKVTSAGRVASCMNCHTRGTNDRMFGLKEQ